MNIAIIPARSCSKRIPNKNIKKFLGKPVIQYSIETAIQSNLFEKVIVSTDSEEIAEAAREAGAEIPFIRPVEIGRDHVHIADVVHHAVKWLNENGCDISYTCCILATAPLLKSEFIEAGFHLIRKHNVDTVMSVTRFSFPVFRAFKKDGSGKMRFIWPEYELTHSSDLPETYHDAAQFYWLDTKKFLVTKNLMGKEVLPVVLPEYFVRDIDTIEDWEMSELMYEVLKLRENKEKDSK